MGEGGGSCRPSAGTQPCRPCRTLTHSSHCPASGSCRASGAGRGRAGIRGRAGGAREVLMRTEPAAAALPLVRVCFPPPGQAAPAEPWCTPKAQTRPTSPLLPLMGQLSAKEPCFYFSCKTSEGGIFQHPSQWAGNSCRKRGTCRPGGRSQAPAPLCEGSRALRGSAGSDRRGTPHGSAAGSGNRETTATAVVCGAQ